MTKAADVADVVAAFDGYDAAVVEDAIPWLALQAGVDVAAAPPSLQAALARFAAKAGLSPGMSKDDVNDAVARFYEANPLPATLVNRLGAVARGLASRSGDGAGGAAAAAKLLGETASKLPVGAGPTPEGAVKNTPFARFTPPSTSKKA